MSVIDFIEKLQQKPRHIRLQIMWGGAIFGAAIIFSFWLWSLTTTLADLPKANQEKDKSSDSLAEIKKDIPGLWQSLSAGIGSVIETAKEGLSSGPSVTPSVSPESQPGIERLPIEQ